MAPVLWKIMRFMCWGVFWGGVVLVFGMGGIRLSIGVAGAVFIGLSFFLISRFRRWAPAPVMAGFGILFVVMFSIGDMMIRSVFYVSPAPELTSRILALNPAGTAVGMTGVSLNYVSQLRVLSQGRITPTDLGDSVTPGKLNEFPLLVCPGPDFVQGKVGKGRIVGKVCGTSGWRPKDFVGLLSPKRRDAIWASRRQEYYVVIPGES